MRRSLHVAARPDVSDRYLNQALQVAWLTIV